MIYQENYLAFIEFQQVRNFIISICPKKFHLQRFAQQKFIAIHLFE